MNETTLKGVLLDEQVELSLSELCSACSISVEWVVALVDVGVLDPINYQQTLQQHQTRWKFSADSLNRARIALRLEQDLGVNKEGVALALDLMDEIEMLKAKLGRVKRQ